MYIGLGLGLSKQTKRTPPGKEMAKRPTAIYGKETYGLGLSKQTKRTPMMHDGPPGSVVRKVRLERVLPGECLGIASCYVCRAQEQGVACALCAPLR